MRVSLLGVGDVEFHYKKLLGLTDGAIQSHIESIAKVLVETNSEIVLVPDKGIAFEIAKKYKSLGGKKVFATVPLKDTDFGITHLKPFIDAKVKNAKGKEVKVIDEIIDTENWYKQDLLMPLFGEVNLVLGLSPGTLRELSTGYYVYKLFIGEKPEVKTKREKASTKIIAGSRVSFDTILYMPFCKEKLPTTFVSYIEKYGCKVHTAISGFDLEEIITSFSGKKQV